MLKEANTVQDVVSYLGLEAKRLWWFLKEIWLDWVYLCYAMFEYTSDEEINKQRQRQIEEREWRKIIYEGTLNTRADRNWKSHTWKINLVKVWVKDYKDRAEGLWKKEYHETWIRPDRRPDICY